MNYYPSGIYLLSPDEYAPYKAWLDSQVTYLWQDGIQENVQPDWGWGAPGSGTAHPIETNVVPSDANGANLSRVADPLGGPLFCIRHYVNLNPSGRSQLGLGFPTSPALQAQIQKPTGILAEAEFLFPVALTTAVPHWQWINLWDFHSVDANGANRQHTSPGIMLDQFSTMKFYLAWGANLNTINPASAMSSIALPVGRWFKIRIQYIWSLTPITIKVWIDGVLALQQNGVITRVATNANVETYLKLYGGNNGDASNWIPEPTIRYSRNLKIWAEAP